MTKLSQKEKIKKHLMKKPITTIQAFELYRITRLSALIHTLRKEGMNILGERKSNKDSWWFKFSMTETNKKKWIVQEIKNEVQKKKIKKLGVQINHYTSAC